MRHDHHRPVIAGHLLHPASVDGHARPTAAVARLRWTIIDYPAAAERLAAEPHVGRHRAPAPPPGRHRRMSGL